jgi:hypothetical protein
MKTARDLEDRIRFLLAEELTARVSLAETRLPHLCTHNHRQPLDVRKRIEDQANEHYNRITSGPHLPVVQTMGLCMLGAEDPEQWPGTICEDPIDAQRCPYFDQKLDKKYIWLLFSSQIRDADWLRDNMPEVHGLLWALNATRPSGLPWWKRLWFRFLRIQPEPLRPTEDVTKLLPPAAP